MNPPTDPILYSFRRCPYAMRARLAIAVSGTRCEWREVKLSAKPAAMLAASPKGTVPVLVLADRSVIAESLDIMHWALAQHDPEAWLTGENADLIASNDGTFKHDLDGYKYPDRHGGDALAYRTSGLAFLRLLDDRLGAQPFLAGSNRGLADAAIMPFVRQFAAVDREWFDAQPLPRLQAWLAHHLASDLFATVMTRVPPWEPGNAPIHFPPQRV